MPWRYRQENKGGESSDKYSRGMVTPPEDLSEGLIATNLIIVAEKII